MQYMIISLEFALVKLTSPWRNRLARSAVNRKVGGSSPPGDDIYIYIYFFFFHKVMCLPFSGKI